MVFLTSMNPESPFRFLMTKEKQVYRVHKTNIHMEARIAVHQMRSLTGQNRDSGFRSLILCLCMF